MKLAEYYEIFKALHIIFIIFWMAGMLYLPRLFVYHVNADSASSLMLEKMESRLARYIIVPAMIISILLGLVLAHIYGMAALGLWFYLKCICVLMLCALHGYFATCIKKFKRKENKNSELFYRIINEMPGVICIAIVFFVVLKPFE